MWDGTSAFTQGKTWRKDGKDGTREYRMRRVLHHGTRERRRARQRRQQVEAAANIAVDNRAQDDGSNTVHATSFQYIKTCVDILQSLVKDKKVRKFIGNLATRRRLLSCVFWPAVWDGILKQASVDVPRMQVLYRDRQWKECDALLQEMERHMSPTEARWALAFLTQAPLADAFSAVVVATRQRHGPMALVCDTRPCHERDGLTAKVTHDPATNTFQVDYSKTFRILQGMDDTASKKRATIQYCISFSNQTAQLTCTFHE